MLYKTTVRSIYTIILILSILFPSNILIAQNNPYKIKDELYGIMQLAVKSNKKEIRFYHLSDSLINEGKRYNDIKAQCLGYYFRTQYFINAKPDDEKTILKVLGNTKEFIAKTPYLQYYFSSWSSYIILLLNTQKYDKALSETMQYQKDAIKMNNSYGISFSYKNLGHIYLSLKNYPMALEQYTQGEKYLESINDNTEIYTFQQDIANIHYLMYNYDKAFEFYNKALKNTITKDRKFSTIAKLLQLSITIKKPENIIDYYYNEWIKLNKEYGNTPIDGQLLTLYSYYSHKGKKAQADSIYTLRVKLYSNHIRLYPNFSGWYASNNNYKDAWLYMKRYSEWRDSIFESNLAEMSSKNLAEQRNNMLMLKQKELELSNMSMEKRQQQYKIEKMNSEQQFMLTSRQRDSLQLWNSTLKHQQDSVSHLRELEAFESQMKEKEQKEKYRNRTNILIFNVLGIIIIFFIITIFNQRRNSRKLKRANEKINEALIQAQKADMLKSQFLNNMSHEIRTPLNAIVGFTTILNDTEETLLEEGERGEMLKLVQKNSELLTTLVNDLLDLSRMQSGNYKVSITSFKVSELCNDTINSVKARTPENVIMKYDAASETDNLIIQSDKNRITQVLTNFLTNSCKYTEQGSIILSCKNSAVHKGCVDFIVTDTGSGIPADKAKEVFERFEKLDEFKQGTGLGLSICKTIAELLKGEVWIDTSYTDGARFVFSMPVSDISDISANT